MTQSNHSASNASFNDNLTYFAHPEAKYTLVGPMNKDQFEDYAAHKQLSLEDTERWLAPNRGY